MPRTNRISFAYSLPNPATLRWSSRATWTGRSSAASRRAASAGSQSSPSGSGPRCPTSCSSSRVGTTSMSARSKPTVSHSAVPTIARAVYAGLRQRSPGAYTCHAPSILRWECRRPVADAVQQVLAARDDAVHGHAAQVDRRRLRHAQLEAGDLGAGEHVVRAAGRCGRRCRPQARADSRRASPAVERRSVSPRGDSTKPASRSARPTGVP